MKPIVKKIWDRADRGIKTALEKDGVKVPCCRGCFHCCREPVYSQLSEVEALLELLSPAEIEALKIKVQAWMFKFQSSGLQYQYMPSAYAYRALYLWCPLLSPNGDCSVYENRPLSCRSHIAMKSSEGCEKDMLRPEQKFATFPDFMEKLSQQRIGALEDGETDIYDHLGLLLAYVLLNRNDPSGSRLEFTRTGNAVTMKQYTYEKEEKEKEDPASPQSAVRDVPVP